MRGLIPAIRVQKRRLVIFSAFRLAGSAHYRAFELLCSLHFGVVARVTGYLDVKLVTPEGRLISCYIVVFNRYVTTEEASQVALHRSGAQSELVGNFGCQGTVIIEDLMSLCQDCL